MADPGHGEFGHRVPPERWSIEPVFDHSDYLSHPVPTYEDEADLEQGSDEESPPAE